MASSRGRSCAGSRALAQDRGERAALDQLHGEERPLAEAADVVDGHDARVLELAADLRLLDEAAGDLRAIEVLLEEDLDGQLAAQLDVAAAEDGAHAAAGDLAGELVAVSRVGGRGHGVGAGPQDVGAVALGVAEQDGWQGAAVVEQAGHQAAGCVGGPAEAGRQAGVERVGRGRRMAAVGSGSRGSFMAGSPHPNEVHRIRITTRAVFARRISKNYRDSDFSRPAASRCTSAAVPGWWKATTSRRASLNSRRARA